MAANPCQPIETAMSLLGRRWAGAVIQTMLDGAERFSDIRRGVPGVTDAVLTTRLKELCERGFAERHVTDGTPVCVSYTLTSAGKDLAPVLAVISDYGTKHHELLTR